MLEPVFKPVLPETATKASASTATAATGTVTVRLATLTEPPSATVTPSTFKEDNAVLLDSGVT